MDIFGRQIDTKTVAGYDSQAGAAAAVVDALEPPPGAQVGHIAVALGVPPGDTELELAIRRDRASHGAENLPAIVIADPGFCLSLEAI